MYLIGGAMQKECFIFGAGDYGETRLPKPLTGFIIAADGGFLFLRKNKIKPDLLVGDFDSMEMAEDEYLPPKERIIVHPPEKNDTDMMLAVKEGFERGYHTFYLYGGVGGRFDHTFANIQTLSYIVLHGGRGFLVGNHEIMTVVHEGTFTIPAKWQQGQYISVFCLGDEAEGVDLINLKYELANANLTKDFPLGTSNEFVGKDAVIRVQKGMLLVVWQMSGDIE